MSAERRKAQPAPKTGLPMSVALPFATPAIPVTALGVLVFVYLPPYFASHLGAPMTMVGLVWMAVRLIDAPADLLLALAMDRTRTPLGRYRPWMALGAPLLMLALERMFMAPVGMTAAYLFVWLFALYLGNSMVSLAHQAWAAGLAPHYHERSRLFGLLNAVGIAGVLAAMAVLIGGPALKLTDTAAMQACGWLIVALAPLSVALAWSRAPEPLAQSHADSGFRLRDYWEVLAKPDLLRLFACQIAVTLGPGWMSAIYLFFFRASRGFSTEQASILLAIYIMAGIPGALATTAIARRIGKHRTLILATTAYSLGLCSILILPRADMAAYAPMMAFEGAWAAGFGMMVQAMLADVGDEIRLAQGKPRMSLVFAVNTLASKIASAGAIGLTFPLLQAFGFNPAEGARNTPQALHNLDLAFLVGPVVFVMLGGASVIGWRMDSAAHDAVRSKLEALDAEIEDRSAVGAPRPSGRLRHARR